MLYSEGGATGSLLWSTFLRPHTLGPQTVLVRQQDSTTAPGPLQCGPSGRLGCLVPPHAPWVAPQEQAGAFRPNALVERSLEHWTSHHSGEAVPRGLLRDLLAESVSPSALAGDVALMGSRLAARAAGGGRLLVAHPEGRADERVVVSELAAGAGGRWECLAQWRAAFPAALGAERVGLPAEAGGSQSGLRGRAVCEWAPHPRVVLATRGAELLRYDLRGPMSKTAASTIHLLEAPGDAFTALAVPECWRQAGFLGDADHLLAAATAATVVLLDLRRPALPLLTWRHGMASEPPELLQLLAQPPSLRALRLGARAPDSQGLLSRRRQGFGNISVHPAGGAEPEAEFSWRPHLAGSARARGLPRRAAWPLRLHDEPINQLPACKALRVQAPDLQGMAVASKGLTGPAVSVYAAAAPSRASAHASAPAARSAASIGRGEARGPMGGRAKGAARKRARKELTAEDLRVNMGAHCRSATAALRSWLAAAPPGERTGWSLGSLAAHLPAVRTGGAPAEPSGADTAAAQAWLARRQPALRELLHRLQAPVTLAELLDALEAAEDPGTIPGALSGPGRGLLPASIAGYDPGPARRALRGKRARPGDASTAAARLRAGTGREPDQAPSRPARVAALDACGPPNDIAAEGAELGPHPKHGAPAGGGGAPTGGGMPRAAPRLVAGLLGGDVGGPVGEASQRSPQDPGFAGFAAAPVICGDRVLGSGVVMAREAPAAAQYGGHVAGHPPELRPVMPTPAVADDAAARALQQLEDAWRERQLRDAGLAWRWKEK
ncbi:hypothetical protein WJX81_005803 [Elliptochloris bilobata]|uniref:Uncharacterized protein n=1 Tax=Elliptochloris bilobata TaxID=381761 RepID=A0AAW1S007_9CHLO